MAYTVTASGEFSRSSGYFTINGTKYYAAGTWTFDSKPTISVYVGSGAATLRPYCKVTLNGETVQSGYGEYFLETDGDVVDIVFSNPSTTTSYYVAAITTSKTDPMEIPFKPSVCTVTITGTGQQNICYALIGGTKHYTAKTLEIASGTEITFHSQIKTSSSVGSVKAGAIRVNGTKVNGTEQNYVYTIKSNIAVKLSYTSDGDGTYSSNITITEE